MSCGDRSGSQSFLQFSGVVWQASRNYIVKFTPTDDVYIAVTGVASVYSASQATDNNMDLYSNECGHWITSFYASTLACNLLSSGEFIQLRGLVTYLSER